MGGGGGRGEVGEAGASSTIVMKYIQNIHRRKQTYHFHVQAGKDTLGSIHPASQTHQAIPHQITLTTVQ